MKTTPRIGIIGLGAMGSRFAERLLVAGYPVSAFNRSAGRAMHLDASGLRRVASPRELAASSDVILIMLWNSEAVSGVIEGVDGVIAGLRAGTTVIDLSTIEPHVSLSLGQQVQSAGGAMVDAPVSGSLDRAADGTLLVMVGSAGVDGERIRNVLSVLARSIVFTGPRGSGLALKLAINLQVALQLVAWGESMAVTSLAGIAAESAASVMLDSVIGSPMLNYRVPFTLEPPKEVWASAAQLLKDVDYARGAGADGPAAEYASTLLSQIVADGRGDSEAAELAIHAQSAVGVRR